jgi:hypothetical protein
MRNATGPITAGETALATIRDKCLPSCARETLTEMVHGTRRCLVRRGTAADRHQPEHKMDDQVINRGQRMRQYFGITIVLTRFNPPPPQPSRESEERAVGYRPLFYMALTCRCQHLPKSTEGPRFTAI